MPTSGQNSDLTFETLRDLAGTEGPCITIVVPNSKSGGAAIELRNAVTRLRSELPDTSIPPDELFEPVLAAAGDLGDRSGGNKQHAVAVILRSPSVMRVLRSNAEIPPLAQVADRFHLLTLLQVMQAEKRFYIIALSQNRTRILKCSEHTSEEVPFPEGVAVSLADAMQTRKPDHVLDNRASAGPSTGSMGGVMFGTSADRESKDEYLLHFFMELDKGINSVLKGATEPLIPVGVEHELALYRRVNTWPHLIEPGVHGAPDGLEGGEMHKRALECLERWSLESGRKVPADFDKRVGTGHASTHIQEIIEAAWNGRVSHLFFQPGAEYAGTFDPMRQRIRHSNARTGSLDSAENLVEAAAWQTLLHSGEAHAVPSTAMPNGVPVCALFRYPAPVATAQMPE